MKAIRWGWPWEAADWESLHQPWTPVLEGRLLPTLQVAAEGPLSFSAVTSKNLVGG